MPMLGSFGAASSKGFSFLTTNLLELTWIIDINHPNGSEIIDMVADSEGNVYAIASNNYSDIEIIKVSKDGNVLWSRTFGSNTGTQGPAAICIGSNNKVYVAGAVYDNNFYSDILIIEYDSNGNVGWQKTLGRSNRSESIKSITFNSGYLYLAGSYVSDNSYNGALAISVIASSGSNSFIYRYGPNTNINLANLSSFNSVGVLGNNTPVFVGNTREYNNKNSGIELSTQQNGSIIQSFYDNFTTGTTAFAYRSNVGIIPYNNLSRWILTYIDINDNGSAVFGVHLGDYPGSNKIYEKRYTLNDYAIPVSFAKDSNNNLYILSNYIYNNRFYITKINGLTGSVIWAKRLTASTTTVAKKIIASGNSIYIAGQTGFTGSAEGFLIKLRNDASNFPLSTGVLSGSSSLFTYSNQTVTVADIITGYSTASWVTSSNFGTYSMAENYTSYSNNSGTQSSINKTNI